MPDNSTSVIIQGKKRFRLDSITSTEPYHVANVTGLDDIAPQEKDDHYNAIISSIKDLSLRIIKASSNIPPEASFAVKNIENSGFLINFVSSNTVV